MKTKVYFIVSMLLLCALTLFSQQGNNCLTVSMKGYLIDAGGKKLFQQCEDSTISFWRSIDNTSFSIWCNQIQDNYCKAIDSIGEAMDVKVRFADDSRISTMRLSYFYCTIKTTLCFIGRDSNELSLYKKPQIEVLHGGRTYYLDHFWVRESLREIIPQKDSDLQKMHSYYLDKGYSVPSWLNQEFDRRAKMKSR